MKKSTIFIRISDELRSKLKERAEEYGMQISEYVRYLILKDIEEGKTRRNKLSDPN